MGTYGNTRILVGEKGGMLNCTISYILRLQDKVGLLDLLVGVRFVGETRVAILGTQGGGGAT